MFFFEEKECVRINIGSVEYGYLSILQDDLKAAKVVFSGIDSPRAKWGISLVEILEEYLVNFPNFFGIRNFLEIDMDFLIKNEKMDYVELLLGSLDFMAEINQETYKYVGRVFLNNKLYNIAKKYFDKSKNIFYNDPELHFLLAKYYEILKDKEGETHYLNECLKILPDYYPARFMLKNISNS